MVEDTLFVKVFGASPRNKVLMFMVENNIFDYSKSDIANYCNVSRATLDSFFDEFTSFDIIRRTRKIGRAVLYRITWNAQ